MIPKSVVYKVSYKNADNVGGFYPRYQQDWLIEHHNVVINLPV
ncbi:hypothetical protein MGSAQ_000140 [marine sediment metagenome]|uniref:Uncharacterized protein n=1 Tax=marine sediment metagenome TaxID=412755 RepID=A0A1B6NY72_9ZZZZ